MILKKNRAKRQVKSMSCLHGFNGIGYWLNWVKVKLKH